MPDDTEDDDPEADRAAWARDAFMMNALRDEIMATLLKFMVANGLSDGKSIKPEGLVVALGTAVAFKLSIRVNLVAQGSNEEAINKLERMFLDFINPKPRIYGELDPVTGRIKKPDEPNEGGPM